MFIDTTLTFFDEIETHCPYHVEQKQIKNKTIAKSKQTKQAEATKQRQISKSKTANEKKKTEQNKRKRSLLLNIHLYITQVFCQPCYASWVYAVEGLVSVKKV